MKMISRIALRRLLLLGTKHQPLTKCRNSSVTVPRFIHTSVRLAQCDDPIEPSLAETLQSGDEGNLEGTFDIDEVLLQTADAHSDELTYEEEAPKEVDEGNFNYDEMLLNSAIEDPDGQNFDVEATDPAGEDEDNFNYDDMLLNSAVDDSGLDVEEGVDVDTFLSRQSDDIRADILGIY